MNKALSALIVVLLLVSLLNVWPATDRAAAETLDYAIAGGWFFTQANGYPLGTDPRGFAIVDDAQAPFWSEFQKWGGVQGVGYPISRRFVWNGFVTQAMQKAVFQWQPDTGISFVNVFDLLHDTGRDGWAFTTRSTPPPLDGPTFDGGKTWPEIIAARQSLIAQDPAMEAQYNSAIDPLMLYGLPTSAITDMGNHRSIRLQRAVIQRWLVDVPWAQAGQVTVGNGGDIAREAGLLPHSAVQPEYPPTPVVPLPTPTVAPPQPACAYLPVRGFGRLWSSNAQVQAALGCPTYPTQDMPVVFLAQRFQGGVMLWTEAEPGFVYALFRDQMKYIAVPDTWREGEAEPPEAAPQGFYTPTGRLGKAWREGTGVRQRLGWALEAQKVGGGWVPDPAAARNGAWQSFMYGTMVWIPYKAGSAEYMSDRWMYIVTKNYPFPPGGSRNDWMEFLEQ